MKTNEPLLSPKFALAAMLQILPKIAGVSLCWKQYKLRDGSKVSKYFNLLYFITF